MRLKKVSRRQPGPVRWFRRHWLTLAVTVSAAFVAAGLIYWHSKTVDAEVAATVAQQTAFTQDADRQLAAIQQRKAAEELARQEAAAAKAADDAANVTDASSADTIDSGACNRAISHNNPAAIDVVVNKKHCLQPLSYTPGDLVTSNGATLSALAASAYDQLFAAAAAAGQGFYVTSSYRSYSSQIATYNYWVSVSGKGGADTYSARPGYSEHQTGLAFDVAANGCVLDCFGSTSQYQWLQQNAAQFGFIQRYYAGYESITGYKAEEWHYRYVGVAVASDMQAKGVKTLEQYWGIEGGDYY